MSATDELRRMLDERGVEWQDGDASHTTEWTNGRGQHCSAMYWKPTLNVLVSGLTPEQAIAATLGDAFTREECEASFVHGYSLGTLPVGSDPQWDENRQTVDEHMAELGWVRERTCIAESHDCGDGVTGLYCSECGNYIDENDNYCPSCGAKVVKE